MVPAGLVKLVAGQGVPVVKASDLKDRGETASGLIVQVVQGVTVSDLKGRGDLGSARDERGKTAIVRIVRVEKVSDPEGRGERVSGLEDRGGNSIAPHDLSVAIDPNDLLPMRNVELMKFVAPRVSVSTHVARFHTSVPPKNGGSMRVRFVRASRRSEANKSQFVNGRVKQWRPSTREPWGLSPLHSVNGMDSSRRVA